MDSEQSEVGAVGSVLPPPWNLYSSGEAPYFSVPYAALPPQIKARRQSEGVQGDGLEFKSLPYKMALKDDGERRVRLWIARMGEDFVDDGGDMILKGAFDETIQEDGPSGQNLIKYFHNHDVLLGPCLEIDAKKDGVQMLGAIDEAPSLDSFYAHAKSGAVAHGSFGYAIKESHRDTFKNRPIRAISKLKCYEGSQVIWPMNRGATLLEVKAARVASAQALLPKGAAISLESKNLWGVASVAHALAVIDGCYQEIARVLADDEYYGTLSEEDRAMIDGYLDMMVANGKDADSKRARTESSSTATTLAQVKAADKLLTALRETSNLFTKGI